MNSDQPQESRESEYAVEINRLRNVIQAACTGGTEMMIERWKVLFPDAPVPTVRTLAGPTAQTSEPVGMTEWTIGPDGRPEDMGLPSADSPRIWTMVEKIRAKQAAKPKHSPLPAHQAPVAVPPPVDERAVPEAPQEVPMPAPVDREGWFFDEHQLREYGDAREALGWAKADRSAALKAQEGTA